MKPVNKYERPAYLNGATVKIKSHKYPVYLTANVDDDGDIIEVFIRTDDPDMLDWSRSNSLFISKQLQLGEPLKQICSNLHHVYSHTTSHSHGETMYYSMSQRIATELMNMQDFLKRQH